MFSVLRLLRKIYELSAIQCSITFPLRRLGACRRPANFSMTLYFFTIAYSQCSIFKQILKLLNYCFCKCTPKCPGPIVIVLRVSDPRNQAAPQIIIMILIIFYYSWQDCQKVPSRNIKPTIQCRTIIMIPQVFWHSRFGGDDFSD